MFPRSPWQYEESCFLEVLNVQKRSEAHFVVQSLLGPGSICEENGPWVGGGGSPLVTLA